MAKAPLPCPTVLRQLLRYEPETGKLFWKPRARIWFKSDSAWKAWTTRFSEQEAFTADSGNGYKTGTVLGSIAAAHRVAFAIVEGFNPEIIDHADGDGTNNRWENISNVTPQQNNRNMKLSCRNTSGHIGVRKCRQTNRWVGQIRVGRGKRRSKSHETKEAALLWYEAQKKELGFHENHGRVSQIAR